MGVVTARTGAHRTVAGGPAATTAVNRFGGISLLSMGSEILILIKKAEIIPASLTK
jgi:hypothetical protein